MSFTESEISAQQWHHTTCLKGGTDLTEGPCYCCCWDCPDNNPHYRAAMQWANNGVMD